MISIIKITRCFVWLSIFVVFLSACDQQPDVLIRESYAGPLPPEAVARLGKGAVQTMTLASNGRDLFVGSDVGLSRYGRETLTELWQIPSMVPVTQTAVSPDDRWLLAGLADGALWLVDAETGEISQSLPGYSPDIGVTALDWQSDEADPQHFVVGFNDGNMLLAKEVDGDVQNVAVFPRASSGIATLAFNPDGRILAAATRFGEILILDVASQLFLGQLDGHMEDKAILDLDWSPAGDKIVSGNNEGEIVEWDLRTFEPVNKIPARSHDVIRVGYLPDGEQFTAVFADGRVSVWSTLAEEASQTQQSRAAAITQADWSTEDRQYVLSDATGPIEFWRYEDGQFAQNVSAILNGYSPDVNHVTAVAYSPDGRHIASSLDKNVIIWQVEDGELRENLTGHETTVASLAWSPDGSQLATADRDGVIRVWNGNDGGLVKRWQAHDRPISSLAWSPDGEKLLSVGSLDDTAIIWNTITLEPIRTVAGEGDGLWSAAWSPNGETIVVGSTGGKMFFWNVENPATEPEATAFRHLSWVTDLEWFEDSDRLVSGGGENQVILWSFENRNSAILPGHSAPVRGVSVHPDEQRVASASLDGLVVIWGAGIDSDNEIEHIFTGHADGVTAVDWSPDGQSIASGSDDGTVIIWQLEAND